MRLLFFIFFSELRKHIAEVEKRQQEYITTKLEERDWKLIESLREIQQSKKEVASTQEEKKKGFFARLFGK